MNKDAVVMTKAIMKAQMRVGTRRWIHQEVMIMKKVWTMSGEEASK